MTATTRDLPAGEPLPGARPGAERPRHLGLALVLICAAQLMVVLDVSIVYVALPSIQRALHFSAPDLIWVVNAYTLAFGGLLLLGGRTGDRFGRRRMFMVGLAVFASASLVGGFATDQAWLLAARAVQGTGAAIAAPTALALIATTFPEGPPRNRAMGIYAAMTGIGAAVGVLLGGLITSGLGWEWVFFVNVPIGAVAVSATPFVLKETSITRGHLDLQGGLIATAGMTMLVWGLIHASTTSWGDPWTIGPLVAGATVVVGFVLLEARTRDALLPLHLFRSRNRSVTDAIVLTNGTAVFATFYFVTLYLQDVLGFSPVRAGVACLPFAAMLVLTAAVTSRVVGRIGTKPCVMAGTAVGAAGLFWFAAITPASTYGSGLIGPMLVSAVGMGMCFVPLTLEAVAGVPGDEHGIASALLNTGQQVGGTLGLAVLGTIAIQSSLHRLGAALPIFASLTPGQAQQYLVAAPAGGHSLVPALLQHVVTGAVVHGDTVAFTVAGGILVGAFLLATFGLRRTRAAGARGAVPVL